MPVRDLRQHRTELADSATDSLKTEWMADTGYDADSIAAAVHARGMKPVSDCNPTHKL